MKNLASAPLVRATFVQSGAHTECVAHSLAIVREAQRGDGLALAHGERVASWQLLHHDVLVVAYGHLAREKRG